MKEVGSSDLEFRFRMWLLTQRQAHVNWPISGRVDRASAIKTIRLGSIPVGQTKDNKNWYL